MKEGCDVSVLLTCATASILISLQSIISQTNCRFATEPNTIRLVETVI